MPRLSARAHEERAEARPRIKEALQAQAAAAVQLDDAIALGVDAGLSYRELQRTTGTNRIALSDRWGHRRKRTR